MAFGGCVEDDSDYNDLVAQIKRELNRAQKRLNSNSIRTDEELSYWEGYVDALESLL